MKLGFAAGALRQGKAASIAALVILAACGQNEGAKAGSTAGSADSADAARAAAAGPTATAPASAPTTRDWSKLVEVTPEGGFRIGNPDAPVKLLEFASLTCPHCAEFDKAAHEELIGNYVGGGKVSYELRNFVMNGPDLAATLLARCQGPTQFFRLMKDLFVAQPDWIKRLQEVTEAEQDRMEALPPAQQTIALAEAAGLDTFMRARGVGKAKFDQCLTDEKAIDTLSTIRQQAVERHQLRGTPHFVLNGEPLPDVTTWAQLEPRLRAAAE
jgi:protein-disulfide isomerase